MTMDTLIANASDDRRIRGVRADYVVVEIGLDGPYDVMAHHKGRRPRSIGWSPDERGVADIIREYEAGD